MALRKYTGMVLVFVLGVAVGGTLIRLTIHRPVSFTEAQKRALRVLDRPVPDSDIGDNRIVTAVKRIEPAVVNIDTVGRRVRSDEFGAGSYGDQEVRGKGSESYLLPMATLLRTTMLLMALREFALRCRMARGTTRIL